MSSMRYDVTEDNSPYANANLLYISFAQSDTDWHSTPHTHACVELFYCIRGTGQFYIAGSYLNIGRDDLVIINPSVEHTEVGTVNDPLEYIVLGIDNIEFSFTKENELQFIRYNFQDKQDEIASLIKAMLKEIEVKNDFFESLCRHMLDVLLIRVFRYIDGKAIPSDGRDHKDCSLAKKYIDANYPENITIDFLAELTHLNKFYLMHAFVREYGISPINYLIVRRIRESKYLLANTNYSLAQISNILGFSSSSYFSQSFRRIENSTPREYRKAHKSN
ncbi:MAG: AraC family transcriptional regulator [Lachnospiraceae bacterium]